MVVVLVVLVAAIVVVVVVVGVSVVVVLAVVSVGEVVVVAAGVEQAATRNEAMRAGIGRRMGANRSKVGSVRFDRTSHLALIALAPIALLVPAEDAGDGLSDEALQEGGPAGETTEDADAAFQVDGPFDGGYPPRPGIWAGSTRPTDAVASSPDTVPRSQPPPQV